MTAPNIPRNEPPQGAEAFARQGEGKSQREIAKVTGLPRHRVRYQLGSVPPTTIGRALSLYDTACQALDAAMRVDEIKSVRDVSEAIRAYARHAKNREMEANAVVLRERAERKLGKKLIEAKAAGHVAEGRPRHARNCSAREQFPRVTLEEAGIDRKLSMRAQKKAAIAAQDFAVMIAR